MKKITGGNIFLKNKLVLYIFVFLALIDVYNHLLYNDTKTLFVLIISGYITSLFTENMTVVLIIALVVSNVFKQTMNSNEYYKNIHENFENDDDNDDDNNDNDNDNEEKNLMDTDSFKNKEKTKETLDDAERMANIQDRLISNLEKMQPMVKEMESFANKYSGHASSEQFTKIMNTVKNATKKK